MDDFLHNLRTGKNKNFDRSRKNFDNPQFKGGDRSAKEKSRGTPSQAALSAELVTAISVTLKDIAESVSRVAEAGEELARAGLQRNHLLEQLLEAIRDKPAVFAAPSGSMPTDIDAADDSAELAIGAAETPFQQTHDDPSRSALRQRIKALHARGLSFKKIAARLQADGETTLSGKGHWHGRSVSRIVNEE